MPYIESNDRVFYDDSINGLVATIFANSIKDKKWLIPDGHVSYVIFNMLKKLYFSEVEYNLRTIKIDYKTMIRAIAVLESVKHELQRRYIDKYEEQKMKENGDV